MTLNEQELFRLLRIDEMTGLFNRAYFLERVRDDMARSERYGWPLSLLLVRLENLDAIEVKRGPIVRDNCLVTTATMIRKFARNTDIPARLSPTTFSLLLPGTPREGAVSIADRLNQRISSHYFEVRDNAPVQVVVMTGLAEFKSGLADPLEFVALAETGTPQARLQSEPLDLPNFAVGRHGEE